MVVPSLRKTQEGERAGRGPEMGSAQACGGCDAQRHRRPAASRDTWLRLTSEKTGSRRGTQAIMRLSEDRPPSPEGPPPWNRGLHCDPRPCPPPCAAKATGHFFNGHDVLKYRLFYPPPKKKLCLEKLEPWHCPSLWQKSAGLRQHRRAARPPRRGPPLLPSADRPPPLTLTLLCVFPTHTGQTGEDCCPGDQYTRNFQK